MGLFKKVKDILFDEEEITNQIKITPEMRSEDIDYNEKSKVKVESSIPVGNDSSQTVQKTVVENTDNDSTFPFFDFDEKEFEEQKPVQRQKPHEYDRNDQIKRSSVSSSPFEYERKKKVEKRLDYGRFEKTEITETVERKKFKPSPIISPVYGILNKDYAKGDVIHRDTSRVDVQKTRDKAFGEKKEEKVEPKTTFYEETETVTITNPEEHQKKVKTIDELLEDTSDVVIDTRRPVDEYIDDEFVENKKSKPDVDKTEMKVEEDTLENDLFDLIDSMYDSDEDGE